MREGGSTLFHKLIGYLDFARGIIFLPLASQPKGRELRAWNQNPRMLHFSSSSIENFFFHFEFSQIAN